MEVHEQKFSAYHQQHPINCRPLQAQYFNDFSDNTTHQPALVCPSIPGEQFESNHPRQSEHCALWNQAARPGQDCYFETIEHVGSQNNHQPPIKYHDHYLHDQNSGLHANQTAADYSACNNNPYYYRSDNKDWWLPAHQSLPNPESLSHQTQSYGYYGYYDHPQSHQPQQNSLSLQHHENIQFSHYQRNYYYESHYEQKFVHQASNLNHGMSNDQQQLAPCDQKPTLAPVLDTATGKHYHPDGTSDVTLQKLAAWSHSANPTGCDFSNNNHSYNDNNNMIATNCQTANTVAVSAAGYDGQLCPLAAPAATINHEPDQSNAQPARVRLKSSMGRSLISKNTTTATPISVAHKTNQCGVCGRNYARPSTLKTHLRTHTNERPFKCNVCLKTFSQAANLTAHQRVHTGERPFSCPICDRQFSQSSSVITHLRTHSGERPYRCNMCSRTFSDSSTLTKHCRIHSGEKPYQCDHCPLNFSQSGNLSRHLRLHQVNSTNRTPSINKSPPLSNRSQLSKN